MELNPASIPTREELEQRLRALEEQARFTHDILELAATLGDFQTSINKLHTPDMLLEETASRIATLTNFTGMAFWLVDEPTSDFALVYCNPPEYRGMVEHETKIAIEHGFFAVALRENRPIVIYSQEGHMRLVYHVLATSSRTRGMFLGFVPRGEPNVPSLVLSLTTIILKSCANALESFELYSMLRLGERLNPAGPAEELDDDPA
ncbi:hypothetical protein [Megalodesulfovibrio paquesii]